MCLALSLASSGACMEEREGSASVRRDRRNREIACRHSSARSARLVARSAHVCVWRAEATRCALEVPIDKNLSSTINKNAY